MAVSKELLERYKKLKAQGVSVSLAELKKQTEAGQNNTAAEQTSAEPVKSGFSALSKTVAGSVQTNSGLQIQNQSYTASANYGQENSCSQNYQYQRVSGVGLNSQTEQNSCFGQNIQPSDYSSPQNSVWQTSYYNSASQNSNIPAQQNLWQQTSQSYTESQPRQNAESAQTTVSSEAPKSTGVPLSVSEQEISAYSDNFTADFDGKSGTKNFSQSSASAAFDDTVSGNGDYTTNIRSSAVQYQQNFTPIEKVVRNKYCLIGYPLGHSLSTYIHDAGFKSLGVDCTYELMETPPEQLVDRIKYLKSHGFAGFNVTIPLKLPVTMFLDEIDVSADIIGAVNTVVINDDMTLKGYNTDVLGFRNAIPQDITLAGKTVALLGTGGAARAAITALAREQVKEIRIFTRNVPNTIELLKYLRENFPQIEFNSYQIERIRDLSDIEILVNTTPIGMQGRAADLTPIEEPELCTLPQGAVVYDVIYNPKKTVLLKLAQKHGYRIINGMDMFIHQAVAAEKIWFGKTPDFKDMKIAALENI